MSLKKALYQIPDSKKVRVIIDTDIDCECDDHYAVAHALMTPKLEVVGIIAEHFGAEFTGTSVEDTENRSYREAVKLLSLMGLEGEIPVLHGCTMQVTDGKCEPSQATKFIVAEAMKEDDRPLFIINQGALTNLAAALLLEPEIAHRMTSIWIGGGAYPCGGWEFNLNNDLEAANIVMDSELELWQVPSNVYGLMRVSFASLFEKVYPCGNLGKYLVENVMRVSDIWAQIGLGAGMNPTLSVGAKRAAYPSGESWHMGDSVAVGLLLDDHSDFFEMMPAPSFDPVTKQYLLRPDNTRMIRVYNYVDSHYVMDDFYSKLRYYFG